VRIEWSPAARASARRYLADQDGMRSIGAAVAALAADPFPPEAFHRGDYHRMRVGQFRVVYVIDDELVTVERVDRIS
jgi:mRNA-degrading endonuclease RelE of RelBE toxin-antitoxin system